MVSLGGGRQRKKQAPKLRPRDGLSAPNYLHLFASRRLNLIIRRKGEGGSRFRKLLFIPPSGGKIDGGDLFVRNRRWSGFVGFRIGMQRGEGITGHRKYSSSVPSCFDIVAPHNKRPRFFIYIFLDLLVSSFQILLI